jgi:hypothetical protein
MRYALPPFAVARNVPAPESFEINDLRPPLLRHPDDSGTAGVRFPDTGSTAHPRIDGAGRACMARAPQGCHPRFMRTFHDPCFS